MDLARVTQYTVVELQPNPGLSTSEERALLFLFTMVEPKDEDTAHCCLISVGPEQTSPIDGSAYSC